MPESSTMILVDGSLRRMVIGFGWRSDLRHVPVIGTAPWRLAMTGEMYFEDYVVGAQRETTGRTITEADVVLHAGQTGDFYPHHMDAEWCKTQDFKLRMAHGTLTFSLAVGATATLVNPCAVSYGYDRLRFLKPVFIGDTIRVQVTI